MSTALSDSPFLSTGPRFSGQWWLRIPIAAVWLYHGLWNKLLAPMGRHAAIVSAAPSLLGIPPRITLGLLGLVEIVLALCVLSGHAARTTAIVQTLLLVLMNAAGLLWARESIQDPGAMIVQNIAFAALIWVAAGQAAEPRHARQEM